MAPRIAVLLGGLFLTLSSTLSVAWVDVASKTTVSVSATAYDGRDGDNNGCDPSGCTPDKTLDGDLDGSSRWSCSTDLGVNECSITYTFGEQQPVAAVYIAFYKGASRTREFEVSDGFSTMMTAESSGDTDALELFRFTNEQEIFMADHITIISKPDDDGEWFSLTEVEIMVVEGDEIGDTSNSVAVSATGFDDRTTSGCPTMCLPSLTRDGTSNDDLWSRWSCLNADATGGLCSIMYEFQHSVDLHSIVLSFYRGDERTRELNVYVDGTFARTFKSSGQTDSWEEITLDWGPASSVTLEARNLGTGWLSIHEVRFYVD